MADMTIQYSVHRPANLPFPIFTCMYIYSTRVDVTR